MENLAQIIGVHAVWLFATAGIFLLGLIALLWWLLERFSERLWQHAALFGSALSRRYPFVLEVRRYRLIAGGVLGLHSLIGFAIVLAALLCFAQLSEHIGAGAALNRFDNQLAATLTPTALHAFYLITQLANARTLTVLGVAIGLVLLLRRHWLLLLSWTLALAGNGLLNRTLKAVFQRTRPLHEHGLLIEQGFSFPSGHASGAMVAYGMLAYLLVQVARPAWHLPIVIAAAALILLIGFSRVFLQVHFFSDVIAGYLSGGAWLTVCVAGTEIALGRRRRDSVVG